LKPSYILLGVGSLAMLIAPTLAEYRRLCEDRPCELPHTHQEVPYVFISTGTATSTTSSTTGTFIGTRA